MKYSHLNDIADQYGCDKGRLGPSDRWSAHNYADVYQAYLHDSRTKPLSLLEIGLGVDGPNFKAKIVHGSNREGGASMKMWYDYLPDATLTGIDINPAEFLDCDRITTYVADQGSREQLQSFLDQHPDPSFDVIIDDGTHRADHQQLTLETLFPYLKPGGLYFIEDLNDFGHGGRTGGFYHTPDTLSSRDFFTRYARTGEIPTPHGFAATDFLSEVSEIAFYCPQPRQRSRDLGREFIRLALGRARRGLVRLEWVPGTERLLALRKAA